MQKKYCIQKGLFKIAGLLGLLFFAACNTNSASQADVTDNLDSLQFTVSEAPEWTALFKREHGWFGGDGIFAIPLNGVDTFVNNDTSKTLFLFGDTMIGDIIQDSLQPGFSMVRNSVAILKGKTPSPNNISFEFAKDENNQPATIFSPNLPSTIKGDIFWLGDGFVNTELDSSLFAFAYTIRNTGTTDWGFTDVGNVLIEIPKGSKPPFKEFTQTQTPFYIKGTSDSANDYASFGAGIFVNTKAAGAPNPDGFVYVYGMRGKAKNVMVARVTPKAFKQFNEWRFFDGKAWSADINAVANITDSASNELSVSPLPDGRYAMVFQVNGISDYVGLRLGKTPYGPFGKVINIWNCSDVKKISKNVFAYNAKAFPCFSKPGELLISYNVNSFDFFNEIKLYPDLYRPRFIKLKLLP